MKTENSLKPVKIQNESPPKNEVRPIQDDEILYSGRVFALGFQLTMIQIIQLIRKKPDQHRTVFQF